MNSIDEGEVRFYLLPLPCGAIRIEALTNRGKEGYIGLHKDLSSGFTEANIAAAKDLLWHKMALMYAKTHTNGLSPLSLKDSP